jgi:hypothetical protein
MRTIQIDVMGPEAPERFSQLGNMVRCHVYIDGRCCAFWTTNANYEALIYDKVFIRDGKSKDSADVVNTTNVFVEEVKPVEEIPKVIIATHYRACINCHSCIYRPMSEDYACANDNNCGMPIFNPENHSCGYFVDEECILRIDITIDGKEYSRTPFFLVRDRRNLLDADGMYNCNVDCLPYEIRHRLRDLLPEHGTVEKCRVIDVTKEYI